MAIAQAWVTLMKDILTAGAALSAIVVAFLWRQQFTWKIKYDVARRLLQATYKVREAFVQVRHPFTGITIDDVQALQEAGIQAGPTYEQETLVRSQRAVYGKRWQRLQEALTELDSASLEAESLWERNVQETLAPLRQCVGTLYSTLGLYLDELENPPLKVDREAHTRSRFIMFDVPEGNGKGNFFSDEITDAIRKIEKFLKPYLKI